MKLKKTQTGQVVFEQDLTDLDISKIELRWRTENSSDLIKRFHGYVPSTHYVGRQLNYSIWCQGHEIGFTGIGSAILAMGGRDKFIGWTKQQRMAHITNVANNWRYTLINNLPPNTGSKVLGLVTRRAREDWKNRYGDELVLLETLVELPRTGKVYIAAGWKPVGNTIGTQYEWKNKCDVLPGDQITRGAFKIGGKVDDTKVKVITGSTTSKLILVNTINKRWQKILCENPKCEECISFNKMSECATCVDRIIRSRIKYYNEKAKYPPVDDYIVPYVEGDERPWRIE